MEAMAVEMQPRMILVGASAYPRDYDYDRVRAICDAVEPRAYLMVDISTWSEDTLPIVDGAVFPGEAPPFPEMPSAVE